MSKMRQLIAAATVLAGITFASTARANDITNIASATEAITLTSGQITVGNPGTVHIPETATFLKEVQARLQLLQQRLHASLRRTRWSCHWPIRR